MNLLKALGTLTVKNNDFVGAWRPLFENLARSLQINMTLLSPPKQIFTPYSVTSTD